MKEEIFFMIYNALCIQHAEFNFQIDNHYDLKIKKIDTSRYGYVPEGSFSVICDEIQDGFRVDTVEEFLTYFEF